MTFSYLTNENDERKQEVKHIRNNSIWLNGDDQHIKSESITGHNFLFVRLQSTASYRAILDHKQQKIIIPVLLSEEGVKEHLKQLNYPRLLTGEVFQIIQRTMPQDVDIFKKGDPVYIVTAGCLKPVNFNFS